MTIVQTEERRSPLATAAVGSVGFTVLLFVVQVVNALDHQRLDRFGVEPRSAHGLLGILFAPLLHAGWTHLLDNTLPVLVLLFLVLLTGRGAGVPATVVIWLVAGVGVWLVGPANTDTVGASSLVFGWLLYLLVRAFISRRPSEIVLAVVLAVVFGGILLGVLPGTPGVSWQGHLFGALGGALAAVLVTDRPSEKR